jgi:hypothetical protein
MIHCANAIAQNMSLKNALEQAHSQTTSYGSSTVLLMQFKDQILNS